MIARKSTRPARVRTRTPAPPLNTDKITTGMVVHEIGVGSHRPGTVTTAGAQVSLVDWHNGQSPRAVNNDYLQPQERKR